MIYVHTGTYIYTYSVTYTQMHVDIETYRHIDVYRHIDLHRHADMYRHTDIQTYIDMSMYYIYPDMYRHIYIYTLTCVYIYIEIDRQIMWFSTECSNSGIMYPSSKRIGIITMYVISFIVICIQICCSIVYLQHGIIYKYVTIYHSISIADWYYM